MIHIKHNNCKGERNLEILEFDKDNLDDLMDLVHRAEKKDKNVNQFLQVNPNFFKVFKTKNVKCYTVYDKDNKMIAYLLIVLDGLSVDILKQLKISEEDYLNTAGILSVLVHPEYRGQKISKKLITFAEQQIKLQGFNYMLVRVHKENYYALKNFKDAGYETASKGTHLQLLKHIL